MTQHWTPDKIDQLIAVLAKLAEAVAQIARAEARRP